MDVKTEGVPTSPVVGKVSAPVSDKESKTKVADVDPALLKKDLQGPKGSPVSRTDQVRRAVIEAAKAAAEDFPPLVDGPNYLTAPEGLTVPFDDALRRADTAIAAGVGGQCRGFHVGGALRAVGASSFLRRQLRQRRGQYPHHEGHAQHVDRILRGAQHRRSLSWC